MAIYSITPNVFQADHPVGSVSKEDIKIIKDCARNHPMKRARICAHSRDDESVHEMMIAIDRESYIPPHRHHNKSESFYVLEGKIDVVLFEDDGSISGVIELSSYENEGDCFYRLSTSIYHTVIVKSDMAVIHEVTNGPFVKEGASDTLTIALNGCSPKDSLLSLVNSFREHM